MIKYQERWPTYLSGSIGVVIFNCYRVGGDGSRVEENKAIIFIEILII